MPNVLDKWFAIFRGWRKRKVSHDAEIDKQLVSEWVSEWVSRVQRHTPHNIDHFGGGELGMDYGCTIQGKGFTGVWRIFYIHFWPYENLYSPEYTVAYRNSRENKYVGYKK